MSRIVSRMARSSQAKFANGLNAAVFSAVKGTSKLVGHGGERSKGSVYNLVKSDIGEASYNRFVCEAEYSVVERIYYCQSGVSDGFKFLPSFLKSKQAITGGEIEPGLINHDFLLVEMVVRLIEDQKEQQLFFRAEKLLASEESRSGIYIRQADENEVNSIKEKNVLLTVELKAKPMSMDKVLLILEIDQADYSVSKHHCWRYAKEVSIKLIDACRKIGSLDDAERKRLLKEQKNIGGRITGRHFQMQMNRVCDKIMDEQKVM